MKPSEFKIYRKGIDLVLTLLDLEVSAYGTNEETQQWVNDFITKYKKEV